MFTWRLYMDIVVEPSIVVSQKIAIHLVAKSD